MLRLMVALAAVAWLQPWVAVADTNWKTSSAVWKAMNQCTDQARKAFPDYTSESNAKRERARQDCLRANNLPTSGGPIPPAPMPAPRQ